MRTSAYLSAPPPPPGMSNSITRYNLISDNKALCVM